MPLSLRSLYYIGRQVQDDTAVYHELKIADQMVRCSDLSHIYTFLSYDDDLEFWQRWTTDLNVFTSGCA